MSKVKTKAKIKKKTKVSTKARIKAKVKKKTKIKARTKVKTKAKTKHKAKKKSRIKTKAKARKFNDTQKETLLTWIEKIVNLHKGQKNGLKSFSGIDEILDKYNQHYTEIGEKFDAIAKFGIEMDPRVIHEHFFVSTEGREKDVNDLYILLAKISKGKVNFSGAKEKIKSIYEKSLAVNRS